MRGRLALIPAALMLASSAIAATGSGQDPISVHFQRGSDTVRLTGALRQNVECCAYRFKARAGHHLPPQLLSSGRNVFEEFGAGFTLLAFDVDDRSVQAFETAAQALGVPLKTIRDSYRDGREAYEARMILVRPDLYVTWGGDSAPSNTKAVVSKAAGLN